MSDTICNCNICLGSVSVNEMSPRCGFAASLNSIKFLMRIEISSYKYIIRFDALINISQVQCTACLHHASQRTKQRSTARVFNVSNIKNSEQ